MPNNLSVEGFHHVAIKATDFDASVKFYSETFGFAPKHAWQSRNGSRAVMLDVGNGSHLEIFDGGQEGVRPEGHWLHIAFVCSDAKGAMEKARQAGCVITMEAEDIVIPSDPPLPVRLGFFMGPDGEVIELFQTAKD